MEGLLTAIFIEAEELVMVAVGVFTRVAAVLFMLPGLGERSIPVRIKLAGALVITSLLSPLIYSFEALTPTTPPELLYMLAAEAVTGLAIGFAFRQLVFVLQIAGTVAAMHLSVAQMFGAGVAPEPEPTIATLLALGGVTLALMMGLHVQTISALVHLYTVLPFGRFPDPSSIGEWATGQMATTFAFGVTLAAPFVAIGFAYNLALGALNRAMPQLLVALVGVPFLLWVGLVALYQVLPTLFDTWGPQAGALIADPFGGLQR